MNQDFDPDRNGQSKKNRDGDSAHRPDRSFDRRDDDRSNDRPRFGGPRNDDGPRFNRSSGNAPSRSRSNDAPRGDEPRFNRNSGGGRRFSDDQNDRPRFDGPRGGGSRFSRDADRSRDGGPRTDRPRFNNDRSDRSDDRRPRFDNDRRDGGTRNERPRFENDRPRANSRPDNFGDRRPRFDADRRDSNRSDESRPRFDRNEQRFGDRTGGSDQSRSRSGGARNSESRFNRDDRSDKFHDDGPRFDRNNDRFGNERRFSDRADDRPRFGDGGGFSRDGKAGERSFRPDRPNVKRVGGFNREADERNRQAARDDNRDRRPSDSRGRDRRSDDSFSRDSRFTPEQRKESGDRRTGQYTKAPNYDLEQARQRETFRRKPVAPSAENTGHTTRSSDPNSTRLNRYIANSGVCSRREADELIAQGDISVNGKVVTEMGYKVKPGDTVKYGTKVLNPERFVYVLVNKPKDYITTTDDPEERRTVMELVADAGNFRIYPVGRLDRNTTGLLLLTNDGELADKLTHPSNNIRKIYQVEIDKPLTEEHFETIRKGIELEDGPIKPDALSIITPDAQVVGIEIHSGRNRIVRRIFEHLGYEVTKLDRTTYAGLTKKDLPRGKWRFLDPKEVVKLKYLN